jgi:hypothetical protein
LFFSSRIDEKDRVLTSANGENRSISLIKCLPGCIPQTKHTNQDESGDGSILINYLLESVEISIFETILNHEEKLVTVTIPPCSLIYLKGNCYYCGAPCDKNKEILTFFVYVDGPNKKRTLGTSLMYFSKLYDDLYYMNEIDKSKKISRLLRIEDKNKAKLKNGCSISSSESTDDVGLPSDSDENEINSSNSKQEKNSSTAEGSVNHTDSSGDDESPDNTEESNTKTPEIKPIAKIKSTAKKSKRKTSPLFNNNSLLQKYDEINLNIKIITNHYDFKNETVIQKKKFKKCRETFTKSINLYEKCFKKNIK